MYLKTHLHQGRLVLILAEFVVTTKFKYITYFKIILKRLIPFL